jgi:SAM-dependent methyltransferase
VIKGFGEEWSRFNQTDLSETDRRAMFSDYFQIFPWERLSLQAVGVDIGCGSGRWSMLVAPRVAVLHCVDPSGEALTVARSNLGSFDNVRFHQAGVDALPFPDSSLDFAYSLGVLHHVPDTAAAVRSVAAKLKAGAPFLVYLYYAFDNRPNWFRLLWRASDALRRVVSRLPFPFRYAASQVLATGVYWPLARTALLLDRLGHLPTTWPLAYYRDKSFYVMRTDALDRFGTKLEWRFTRRQIREMLETCGFVDVRFSETPPFWCAVCVRR